MSRLLPHVGGCRVQRAPGTMLTSITTVWHMCVCVTTGLMCTRGRESPESGDVVQVSAHTYTQASAQTLPSQKTRTHTGMPGAQADWAH